jgi:hypothetical protein
VKPHLRGLSGVASDRIGALVHDLEAHVLEHGHALGQRDRPPPAPHLQADGVALVPVAAMKVGGKRAIGGEAFDDADIVDGRQRRIVLAITIGEGVAIAFE